MQVTIPSAKKIKQKIVEHPTASYYGFLGLVFVASYAVTRCLVRNCEEDTYIRIDDEVDIKHLENGDPVTFVVEDMRYKYAPVN